MGLFDFLKKSHTQAPTHIATPKTVATPYINDDPEREMVLAITTQDMTQFTSMPYHLDCAVKHFIRDGVHPFAYIDLDRANRKTAIASLHSIDAYIRKSWHLSRLIPQSIRIPIDEMHFTPDDNIGHTRIICTPYTRTGKLSKYPLHLHFTTNLRAKDDETHGQLYYTQDGKIGKANVYIWINHVGYLYYLKTINAELVIDKIESNASLPSYALPSVIYKRE